MSAQYYYDLCSRHLGKNVEICCGDDVYVGIIEDYDNEYVYLREIGPPSGQGPGLFLFPFALGALISIPLTAISGFGGPFYW